MSFQAPVSGPVARSLPKDVIRVRQVPAGVAGIKQNVISNCASALRRSRLRIGAVRSRARKQAVVAQTITSPCLDGLQRGKARNRLKIAVPVPNRGCVSDRDGGDQAVRGGADRQTFSAALAVDRVCPVVSWVRLGRSRSRMSFQT